MGVWGFQGSLYGLSKRVLEGFLELNPKPAKP